MLEAYSLDSESQHPIDVPLIRHFPLKRIFDIAFSAAALVFGAPLFLFLACLIRVTSRGPVLFSQERIGRGGVPFRCYKFRTMYEDAQTRLEEILCHDPIRKAEWLSQRKLKKDPRVTPLGRLLRRTSLDELPQFWNVFKGDLSVVGPRAVVYDEVIQFMGSRSRKILSIRPGLTGLWQVSGRSDTTYAERVALDCTYIDTRTFTGDLRLILRTIPVMLGARGAY